MCVWGGGGGALSWISSSLQVKYVTSLDLMTQFHNKHLYWLWCLDARSPQAKLLLYPRPHHINLSRKHFEFCTYWDEICFHSMHVTLNQDMQYPCLSSVTIRSSRLANVWFQKSYLHSCHFILCCFISIYPAWT